MKKTYVKPMIQFEDFKLSASIASGCVHKTEHAEYVCAYDFGGVAIFLNGITACEFTEPTDQDATYGICYHKPANSNLFDS